MVGPFRVSSTNQACLRCLKHLQNQPHTWEARIFYLLCQHNSQMLMLAYYAQNYASIICKTLAGIAINFSKPTQYTHCQ